MQDTKLLSFLLWMLVSRDWLTFAAAASTEANENREDVGDAVLAAVCPRDRDRLWCLASRGLDPFLAKEKYKDSSSKESLYFCCSDGQKLLENYRFWEFFSGFSFAFVNAFLTHFRNSWTFAAKSLRKTGS